MSTNHLLNVFRAYVAASWRTDRMLMDRVESARRASEIHKRRTGRSLRITKEIVMNEEMYEEEYDDRSLQYRRHSNLGSFHQPIIQNYAVAVVPRTSPSSFQHRAFITPDHSRSDSFQSSTSSQHYSSSSNSSTPPRRESVSDSWRLAAAERKKWTVSQVCLHPKPEIQC